MNGIIIINKPKGFTSNDVVQQVRKILQIKQVGHCGTLDPLATGVLPILVGQATKVSKYLVEHDKTYIATIELGQKTSTGDLEGNIIESKSVNHFSKKFVEDILHSFIGEMMQVPPIYSAVKLNGKKLYEYAREGISVSVEPRKINIYEMALISYNNEAQEIQFKVKCSKGTYIRTLCEDIAKMLNTVGYMNKLNRIKVRRI